MYVSVWHCCADLLPRGAECSWDRYLTEVKQPSGCKGRKVEGQREQWQRREKGTGGDAEGWG